MAGNLPPPRSRLFSSSQGASSSGGKNSCSSGEENSNKTYEKKYHYSFAVSEVLNARIQKCKSLLSGKYPEGVSQEILLAELTEIFLEKKDPERRAARREKRSAQARNQTEDNTESSRYIKPATRDAVFNRDNGQCTFVGSNGKPSSRRDTMCEVPRSGPCESTWDLEIHHDETPFARGGGHSIKNLRLLCAAHNKLEAERVFGRDKIRKYARKRE